MSEMAEAIRELIEEKGVSEESVKQTVESALKAAYKKTFGTADNCEVQFADDLSDVSVYSRKVIVDGDRLEQLDSDIYFKDNGMEKMSKVFRGNELFGQVDLKNIYRSKIASLAQQMK